MSGDSSIGIGIGLALKSYGRAFRGLLNEYPGAAAAYSLRKLSSSTTNVVRVRRASDNDEQDFTAAEVSDGTLESFCGVGDGFVETWYDQSGNGNDATQSVAASQPKIVDAGVLVSGGIDFDGVDDVLIATGSDISGSYTNFSVETYNGSGSTVVYGRKGSTGRHNRNQFGGNTINAFFGGTTALSVNGDATVQHLSTLYFDVNLANNHKIAYNGSAFSTNGGATAGTQELGEIGLGAEISSVTAYGNSKIAEVIFYESDQSANRVAIETNINAHYNIY